MNQYISVEKANVWIMYLVSFVDYPIGLSKEDWSDWHPRLINACRVTTDAELRMQGLNAVPLFNKRYYS